MNQARANRWDDLIDAPPLRRVAVVATYVSAAFAPFALLILLMLLLEGPEQQSRGGSIRMDLLFFTYPAGAAMAGALMGLFLPATRYLWTALVAGMASLAPWVLGIGVTFDRGYAMWTSTHTFTACVMTLILGGGFGLGFYAAAKPKPRRRRST